MDDICIFMEYLDNILIILIYFFASALAPSVNTAFMVKFTF